MIIRMCICIIYDGGNVLKNPKLVVDAFYEYFNQRCIYIRRMIIIVWFTREDFVIQRLEWSYVIKWK